MSQTMYSSAQLSAEEKTLILQKVNAAVLIRLVSSMLEQVHFKRTYSGDYRAGKNNRYAIYRSKLGQWRFKDFSEDSGLPTDFLGLICHKHLLNPKHRDDYLKMWKIAASLSSLIILAPSASSLASKPKEEAKDYQANDDGRKLKVSFRLGYVQKESPLNEIVLDYFRTKIQAPNIQLRDLHKARLYPISSFQHQKGGKHYCHSEDFGFASISGSNIKLKLPCRLKGQREYVVQWKGNRVYGYDQLAKTAKKLIFCAGETDTFAINYFFNSLGIYAICLGGESFRMPAPLVADLRKRFTSLYTFFDNDKTGWKASQRAKERFGIQPVSWARVDDEPNDVCDVLQKRGLKALYAQLLD